MRDAICHGVLTKDDNFDTVLHPTDGGEAFVLRERVPDFVRLSRIAYGVAAGSLHANLMTLSNYIGVTVVDVTMSIAPAETTQDGDLV